MPLLMVVLTSALFAGLVATCATVAVERLGGKLGGVLATTPSTIIAAAAGVFVAAPSEAAFQAAMSATPRGCCSTRCSCGCGGFCLRTCPSGAWARGWR
ncbi:MAG: DUF3147 family protein [Deltaproteobacteria bacterium]|nr:DUF3147 family protein [Deltaproteobacteria bacterium]